MRQAPNTEHALTASLSHLVVGLTPDDLPAAAMDLVERAFIDTIGCILAGSQSDEARLAAEWAGRLGTGGGATVLGGRGERYPAALAGMVNATAGHALDLDDVSPAMTHPSTCLVPPLLALGEQLGSSGEDVMMAYVAGFEVCVRLCRLLNPEHYYRGWHSMSTVNGLGVAAGAARLLGLDAHGVRMAIATAAASSSGIRKNFGTMVKPLHAGQSAFHGVQAAELAAAGFIADDSILEGEHGFIDVFGNGVQPTPEALARAADPERLELVESGLIFKQYACCGALHPAIDVVREIVVEHQLEGDDITGIDCAVNSRALHVLVHHRATTPAEGRFSVEWSLAVSAIDGQAGPAQFTPERIADDRVQDLAGRVRVSVDADLPTGYALFPAIVTVRTADAVYERRRDLAHGDPQQPLGDDEILGKFRTCASFVLDADSVVMAESAVRSLRSCSDVRVPMAVLAG